MPGRSQQLGVTVVTQRFLTIGRVKRSFGVNGAILADVLIEPPYDALIGASVWVAPPPMEWRTGTLLAAQSHGNGVKLVIEGLDTIDAAKKLSEKLLIIERDAAQRVLLDALDAYAQAHRDDKGRFEGFTVIDDLYGEVGAVSSTIATGSNDVWVVKGRYGEVLVPVIDEVIETIDEANCLVGVRLLPGLIEEDPR